VSCLGAFAQKAAGEPRHRGTELGRRGRDVAGRGGTSSVLITGMSLAREKCREVERTDMPRA